MSTQPKCPKCEEQMEEGFVADMSRTGVQVSCWIAGPPEPSAWTGIKLSNRENIKIRTFRCVGCGYLESYANK